MQKIVFPLFFFFPFLLFSQESLLKDTAFFREQTKLYQKWLEEEGLSQVFEIRDFLILPQNKVKDVHLSLRLRFLVQEKDSALRIWAGANQQYLQNEKIPLQEALFDKMTYFMQVPEDNASIQIQLLDGRRGIFIYLDESKLVIEGTEQKSIEPDPISISLKHTGKKMTQAQFDAKYTNEYVLGQVFAFAQNRYQKQKATCKGRQARVQKLRSAENQLRFEVLDLCLEVLTDEQESPICGFYQMLGGDCNWKTREWLTCTFTYLPNPTSGGFSLHLRVDGKVGSGYYDALPRSAYHDMETDYKEYLERYADKIMEEVRVYLLRN